MPSAGSSVKESTLAMLVRQERAGQSRPWVSDGVELRERGFPRPRE